MKFDFEYLESLRSHHPSWRLLRSDHAPLIASFLRRVFIDPNTRVIAAADLAESLEDELFGLRQRFGDDAFPRSAVEYLADWAAPERGWLRRFYTHGSDEPQFDLTPATEKAIAWLTSLSERNFVGTESRLLTLFELLRQMSEGSESDPEKRIAYLRKRRDEIDAEIARVGSGHPSMLDETGLRDRFQQFTQLARDLLTDFREVEQNFRLLDRRVRERIALWEGGKGELLEDIMGERDQINDSDEGRSFRAFWDFLMSSSRQDELSGLLHHVLSLPPIVRLAPDPRTSRIHYDWLEAGEHTQRTVAQLSQQLRRFLDNQTWLENRRIMEILRDIEGKALAIRNSPPTGVFMQMSDSSVSVRLPMERTLYSPPLRPHITSVEVMLGENDTDYSALYDQVVLDKPRLIRHIRHTLESRQQVSLRELIEILPLEHGLAELVAYLQLGSSDSQDAFRAVIDESVTETISWLGIQLPEQRHVKQARLPRVIFVR